MSKLTWQPVTECDNEETGEHTCWAAAIHNPKYGCYVWVTRTYNNMFSVDIDKGGVFTSLAECKSLISAMRWAETHLT